MARRKKKEKLTKRRPAEVGQLTAGGIAAAVLALFNLDVSPAEGAVLVGALSSVAALITAVVQRRRDRETGGY
jgi:hypothetical protein